MAIDARDVETVWQGASPHGSEHLPNGGPTCANAACVVTTAKILRRANRPDLPHMTVLEVLRLLENTPGAFVDSQGRSGVPGAFLMDWAKAAPALGLECDTAVAHVPDHEEAQHEWFGGHLVDADSDLAGMLAEALVDGGAAVRVDVDGDGKGDHTMAGVLRKGSLYVCSDPALASLVDLDENLEAPLIKWNGRAHPYRVVGIRAVRAATP